MILCATKTFHKPLIAPPPPNIKGGMGIKGTGIVRLTFFVLAVMAFQASVHGSSPCDNTTWDGKRLNIVHNFSASQQQELYDLMDQYLWREGDDIFQYYYNELRYEIKHGAEGVVGAIHGDSPLFLGWHKTFIRSLENWLIRQGADQFVPLPAYYTCDDIPSGDNGAFQNRLDCHDYDNYDTDHYSEAQCDADNGRIPANTEPNYSMPANLADLPGNCSDWSTALDFSGDLETGYHNTGHGAIGGIMNRPEISPFSPIFWLWHAAIDDIWYAYETHCNNAYYDIHDGAVISGTHTWDSDKNVRGEIVVENGATLTITNEAEIRMLGSAFTGHGGGITVQPGGALNIDNATITGIDEIVQGNDTIVYYSMWDGIHLAGGTADIQNSILKNADTTVFVVAGGSLEVQSTTFENNNIGILFGPSVSGSNAIGEVKGNTFRTTRPVWNARFLNACTPTSGSDYETEYHGWYASNTPGHDYFIDIQGTGNNRILIEDNDFVDDGFRENHPVPESWGTSIRTMDSDVIIRDNTFEDQATAIHLGNYNALLAFGNTVENNVFARSHLGIFGHGNAMHDIFENEFYIEQKFDEPFNNTYHSDLVTEDLIPIGVFLRQNRGVDIKHNDFSAPVPFNVEDARNYGIKFKESLIEIDMDENPPIPVSQWDEYSRRLAGSLIYSNDFEQMRDALRFRGTYIGTNIDCNAFDIPDLNISYTHGIALREGFLSNQGYCDDGSGNTNPAANHFAGNDHWDSHIWINTDNVPGFYPPFAIMPIEYNSVESPSTYIPQNVSETTVNVCDDEEADCPDPWESRIGGNTPIEAIGDRQGQIEAVEANTGLSEDDKQTIKIVLWSEIQYLVRLELRELLSVSNFGSEPDFGDALNFIEDVHSLNVAFPYHRLKAGIHYRQENWDKVMLTLNEMPRENHHDSILHEYTSLLTGVRQENRYYHELNSQELDDLQEIAASDALSGANAQNILHVFYNDSLSYTMLDQIVKSDPGGQKKSAATSIEDETGQERKVWPNPFEAYFNVAYNMNEAGNVTLYTLEGRKVLRETLSGGTERQTIKTEHLPKGVYIYVVQSGNSVIDRGKLIRQ